MLNRKALEDAVFDAYPDIDMSEIERMPVPKLEWLLAVKTRRVVANDSPAPSRHPVRLIWSRTDSTYAVRDGVLVHVETWRAGDAVREYVQPCGDRVWYDGRTVSASILRHFLLTGDWVKRIPKPRRYRGVVRTGGTVRHVGYFSTKPERDAAVALAKIGIFPNGSETA